jgi:hypothetical protein
MKTKRFLIILSFLSLVTIAVALSYASSIKVKCHTCEVSGACEGAIRGDSSSGAPVGCKEKIFGEDCKGTCTVCRNGGSGSFCKFTGKGSDVCIGDSGTWTPCGDSYEKDCTGGPFPECDCTGEEEYKDDDCKLHFCME